MASHPPPPPQSAPPSVKAAAAAAAGVDLSLELSRRYRESAPESFLSVSECRGLPLHSEIFVREDGGVAGAVWDATALVLQYIRRPSRASTWRGLRAVELGAGVGLAGIELAARGAAVVCTDLPEALDLIERNVARSGLPVDVCAHRWGAARDPARLPDYGFDVVVACECIYNLAFADALLESIDALCRPGGTLLFAWAQRQPKAEMEFMEGRLRRVFPTLLEASEMQEPPAKFWALRKR